MASSPISTVLEESRVSPPATTVSDTVLPLTYFDFLWLTQPPIHYLFFYELSITKTQFIETVIPDLKHSLSITLQHFFPFAGKLTVFTPSVQKKPEIHYDEGDSVAVTFAECNLDFNELTGNHPRDCGMFYHLTPLLGEAEKTSDFIKIPLFSVQVTLFTNYGISIGMTNHHGLGDASTRFCFLNAWTSIARSGSDESFLANGTTLPVYDRVLRNPKLEESCLKFSKVESFIEEYEPKKLCGPTDKLRATFILTRTVLNSLKKLVSTLQPTLAYVSSFTVACAYIWSCLANTRKDELQLFGFAIDCRTRMNPPMPTTYFGNCVSGCLVMDRTSKLMGKEGFATAAKLIGESLHKTLTDKDGVMKVLVSFVDIFENLIATSMIGVAGTPKLKFYEMDFGWGKPKKIEIISIDYSRSISMNACKEKSDDIEIGVCLSSSEMESFVRVFKDGLQTYI